MIYLLKIVRQTFIKPHKIRLGASDMEKRVTIRFTEEEESQIISAMMDSGDKQISSHIKRIYFKTIGYEDQMEEIKQALNGLELRLINLQKIAVENNNESIDTELLLTVMSGMYVMLRSLVNDRVKNETDQHINIASIENYLKG